MVSNKYPLNLSLKKLENVLIEFAIAVDAGDNWYAVRVSASGEIYLDEATAECFSEDEHHRLMPHTVTVMSSKGHGDCILDEFELRHSVDRSEEIAACIKKLEFVGYEVMEVD